MVLKFKMCLVLGFVFFSQVSHAGFSSKEELIDSIHRAGFNQVITVGVNALASFKIYMDGARTEMSISQYIHSYGAERVTRLDIDGRSLVPSKSEAYAIADSIICYNSDNIINRIGGREDFYFCLLVPVPVTQVISALDRLDGGGR